MSDDRPQPILLFDGPDGSTWAVSSATTPWQAHILALYRDGRAWCGCPRQKKGDCWHVQEARTEQVARALEDVGEDYQERVAELQDELAEWMERTA